MFIAQDFEASDWFDGAKNFKSIIETDEENGFNVEEELRQLSVLQLTITPEASLHTFNLPGQ